MPTHLESRRRQQAPLNIAPETSRHHDRICCDGYRCLAGHSVISRIHQVQDEFNCGGARTVRRELEANSIITRFNQTDNTQIHLQHEEAYAKSGVAICRKLQVCGTANHVTTARLCTQSKTCDTHAPCQNCALVSNQG